MQILLKILNEVKGRKALKVDGYSGIRYKFDWNPAHKGYTYMPRNQQETDDLYKTVGRVSSCIFAPILVGESTALPPTPKPAENKNEALREQCFHRGVVLTSEDTNDTALRLIRAYDQGVSDTLQSVPTKKKRPQPDSKEDPS